LSIATPATGNGAVGLADIFKMLRRRALLIVAITVVLTLLAALALSRIPPRYSAQALVQIEERGSDVANIENALAGRTSDAETVMGEIEVLKSTRIANKLINRLALNKLPEFNDELEDSAASSSTNAARSPRTVSGVVSDGEGDMLIQGQRVRIIQAFLKRLDVEPVAGSRIVSVAFSSEDPVLAATVVNTLLDLYLDDQMESKFESVQRATNWLNTRVESLREKVRLSEQRVEAFREQSGLLEGGGTTLADQEILQINSQLIAATNERSAAQANLSQIRRLLKSENGVEAASTVLDSPPIERLREQEAGVLRRLAELTSEYGERHPTMVKLRAEAADLAAKIAAEIDSIVEGLQTRVRIAYSKEASLKKKLEAIKGQVNEDNKSLVTLRSLEREADANRLVLESMLTRFAQTSERDDLASQRPDAREVSRAVVPEEPSYPMKTAILALAFLAAAFLGLMIALVLESLDDALRSTDQLERATGMLPLGLMPRMGRRELKGRAPLDYLLEEPTTAFSESVRALFSAIVTKARGEDLGTLLITSSTVNEGKTTVATCLASMMATSGKRVALVDADSRRGSVAGLMGLAEGPGLMEVLNDRATLSEVLHKHEASGVHVIGAGKAPLNPPAALASPRFAATMRELKAHYDIVIVDSPPIMAVSDALTIAGNVDATLMVAQWGRTKRTSLALSARQLNNAGARLIGGVLTHVDAGKYALYGYGDSGSYTGKLANY